MWLAPLAGYTDIPFRCVCKEWGADVMVSEMVSADGINHNQKHTLSYLDFTEQERPFGVQLFGSNPVIMAKAAEKVIAYKPDFIDINMGCPAKKVTKRGAGGALMSDVNKASDIVKSVKRVIPKDMIISVKFRSGLDINNINYLDFGTAMQDSGADLIILHPRTVKQGFTGYSNWEHIAELKKKLAIPIIGNGDITSVKDAIDIKDITNCDSIMIGRGALGNPWIFSKVKSVEEKNPHFVLNDFEKYETIIRHIQYALTRKYECVVVKEIRAHLCYYTKGITNSAKLRDMINHTNSITDLKKLLTEAFIA